MSTNWSRASENTTQWSSVSIGSTSFQGREVVNLGVIMDDTVYLMDDSVATMDDMKLQSNFAPATSWT